MVLLVVLLCFSFTNVLLGREKDNPSVFIGIDFFNRFQSDESCMFTEAFQRYHTLTVKYDQNPWSIRIIYDWLDKVSAQYSVHTLNVYGMDLSYQFLKNQTLILNYRGAFDIITKTTGPYQIGLDMIPVFPISKYCSSECRYGFRWDGHQLKINVGTQLTFGKIVNIGVNYLSPEDNLVFRKDCHDGIPVSLGVTLPFNDYNSLVITYDSNLIPAADGINQWLKTSLHFKL